MKHYKPVLAVTLAGMLGSLLLCMFGAWLCLLGARAFWIRQQQAEIRQQEVSITANEIFDSLYVPPDAVLLDKVERSNALAYARGCTGALIEAAYGIDRPLDEVMAEYHHQLLESGWEPPPGWDTSQVEGYAVYQKDRRTKLTFNTDLGWTSLSDQDLEKIQFATVYIIRIVYTKPSNKSCIG